MNSFRPEMKNLLHKSKVLSETIKNINIPMRKLLKERKLFKGGNYMRKYGIRLAVVINHNSIQFNSNDIFSDESFVPDLNA